MESPFKSGSRSYTSKSSGMITPFSDFELVDVPSVASPGQRTASFAVGTDAATAAHQGQHLGATPGDTPATGTKVPTLDASHPATSMENPHQQASAETTDPIEMYRSLTPLFKVRMIALLGKLDLQVAAQDEAIAKLILDKDLSQKQSTDIQDMKMTVQNLSEQLASQTGVIDRLKAECASQAGASERLEADKAAQTAVIDQIQASNATQASTIEQLRAENAELKNKVETLSEMQKLHNTTSTAQQGHLSTLDSFVRQKLNHIDSSITSLRQGLNSTDIEFLFHKTGRDSRFAGCSSTMEKNSKAAESLSASILIMTTTLEDLERSTSTRFAKMEEKIDGGMNEINALREKLQTSQDIVSGLANSITKLTTPVEELQAAVATIKSRFEEFIDRFAPISFTDELEQLQQRFASLDAFAEDLGKQLNNFITEVLPKVETDIFGLRSACESNALTIADEADSLKTHNAITDVKLERIDKLEEMLKSTQHDLTLAKESIRGISNGQQRRHLETSKAIEDSHQNMANKLTPPVEGLQTTVATIESKLEALNYRFAPISLTHELGELQQCFDSKDDFVAELDRRLSPVEQNQVDIARLPMMSHIETLKKGYLKLKESIDQLESKLKCTQRDLTVAEKSVGAVKEVQLQKDEAVTKAIDDIYKAMVDRLDYEITKLRTQHMVQQSPGGEPEIISKPSDTLAFGREGTVDPYGDDFEPIGHPDEDGHFESYEEDRRCGKCGNDLDEDEKCKEGCKGEYDDSESETGEDVLDELVDVST